MSLVWNSLSYFVLVLIAALSIRGCGSPARTVSPVCSFRSASGWHDMGYQSPEERRAVLALAAHQPRTRDVEISMPQLKMLAKLASRIEANPQQYYRMANDLYIVVAEHRNAPNATAVEAVVGPVVDFMPGWQRAGYPSEEDYHAMLSLLSATVRRPLSQADFGVIKRIVSKVQLDPDGLRELDQDLFGVIGDRPYRSTMIRSLSVLRPLFLPSTLNGTTYIPELLRGYMTVAKRVLGRSRLLRIAGDVANPEHTYAREALNGGSV